MDNSIYRIIDANFNRAREAARVMEEFCRFYLNSEFLTARIKQLRHELCTEISKFQQSRLLANRDTEGDVGIGKQVKGQLSRKDINDSFTAACKRFSEAMRVLAETTQSIDPEIAASFEDLRYRSYALEKDAALQGDCINKFKNVKLYVLISSDNPLDIISMARCCAIGEVDCIQIRCKNTADDQLVAVCRQVSEFCRDMGVICIVNDRVDIAIASSADGVHLGQHDISIEDARKLQQGPMIIGKSTHNMNQLEIALAQNPSYVAAGPVFESETKEIPEIAGLDYIKKASARLKNEAPKVVAIGGINLDNLEKVLSAGADAVAVCSAITKAPDPIEACKNFKKKLDQFFDEQKI